MERFVNFLSKDDIEIVECSELSSEYHASRFICWLDNYQIYARYIAQYNSNDNRLYN